ncbi:MAG: hypothetical protein H7Y00_04855, partial [Fimbriimonadaceae bacterium]|nr:hypothetical protein [Chitinophagales bacterium]
MAENPGEIKYTEMSAEEFVNHWKGFVNESEGYNPYTFRNIEVKEQIYISSEENLQNIALAKCKINSIWVNKCFSGYISIQENTIVDNLRVDKESRIDGIQIYDSEIKHFYITGAIIGNLIISNTKLHNNLFIEGESILKNTFYVKNKSFLPGIYIKEGVITADIDISDSMVNYLNIEKSKILALRVIDNSICGKIRVRDSSTDNIRVLDSMTDDISLFNLIVKNLVIIQNATVPSLEIGDCENAHEISITNTNISSFNLINRKSINVKFSFTKFENIDLEGSVIPKDTSIQFNDCQVNHLIYSSTQNHGNIYFQNLSPLKKFQSRVKGPAFGNNSYKRDDENKYIFQDKTEQARIL